MVDALQTAAILIGGLASLLGLLGTFTNIFGGLRGRAIGFIRRHRRLRKGRTFENLRDWGHAPDLEQTYGRNAQLAEISDALQSGKYRCIVLNGIGGVGKTHLSIAAAQENSQFFDAIVWRKLLNAPDVLDLTTDLLRSLSNQEIDEPHTIEAAVSQLLDVLRNKKSLVILDNLETVLDSADSGTVYASGYEGYRILFEALARSRHWSTALLTTRVNPPQMSEIELEQDTFLTISVQGLMAEPTRELFDACAKKLLNGKEYTASEHSWKRLAEFYGGNPLVLLMAARHVAYAYDGNVDHFLDTGKPLTRKVRSLFEEHLAMLTESEREIFYWLAINREPVQIRELNADLLVVDQPETVADLIEQLDSKVPVERSERGFTLQPVLIEYATDELVARMGDELRVGRLAQLEPVTERLTTQVSEEIVHGRPNLFMRHALMKATAPHYIREAQKQLLVKRLSKQLLNIFASPDLLVAHLDNILDGLRASTARGGYSAANVLHLLDALEIPILGRNFENLYIRQAYFQESNLVGGSFKSAEFERCVFMTVFAGVLCLDTDPSGHIAVGDMGGSLTCWQTEPFGLAYVGKGHGNWVSAVAFDPDGRILTSGDHDGIVIASKWETGEVLWTYRSGARVRGLDFLDAGRQVAIAGEDGFLHILDAQTGEVCIPPIETKDRRSWGLATTSMALLSVTGGEDGLLRLWNCETGHLITWQEFPGRFVQAVALAADGGRIAAGLDNGEIVMYDVDREQMHIKWRNTQHTGAIRALALSADERWIFSGSEDYKIHCLSTLDGSLKTTMVGHRSWVRGVSVTSDDRLVSGSQDGVIKVWSPSEGICLDTVAGYSQRIWSAAFTPDGAKLVTSLDDGELVVWSLQERSELSRISAHETRIWNVSLDLSGNLAATGSEDCTAALWDIDTGTRLGQIESDVGFVWPVAIMADKRHVVVGTIDQILVWDTTTNNIIKRWRAHEDWVRSISVLPDGRLVSASDDGSVVIWSKELDGKADALLSPDIGILGAMTVAPAADLIAAGGDSGRIAVWRLGHLEDGATILEAPGRVWSLSGTTCNAGVRLLAGCDDGQVASWLTDFIDAEPDVVKVQEGHVWIVATSPCKRLGAAAGEGERITLLDMDSMEVVGTLNLPRPYENCDFRGVHGLTPEVLQNLADLGALTDV